VIDRTPATTLARIAELLATGQYEWARRTLEGIYATVEATSMVTLKQYEAVEHIIVGRLKHDVGPVWRDDP